MILEIPNLVTRLVPGLFKGQRVSTACVRTTRPKFLVFGRESDKPVCVVQFGPEEELKRVHEILCRLHSRLPNVVADSLVCMPWKNGSWVQIQTGLPGMPWFRLTGAYRSRGAWAELRSRALAVLARVHAAVQEVPEWAKQVCPAEELQEQAALYVERDGVLSPRAQDAVREWSESLEALAGMSSFWQHGDFCLNNLLVSADHLALIDFEEFGATCMPLQDQMGLALSVNALRQEAGVEVPRAEDLRKCLGPAQVYSPLEQEHLPGLFLYHLLWRTNQCHGWPTRARNRNSLGALIELFVENPDSFFPSCRALKV